MSFWMLPSFIPNGELLLRSWLWIWVTEPECIASISIVSGFAWLCSTLSCSLFFFGLINGESGSALVGERSSTCFSSALFWISAIICCCVSVCYGSFLSSVVRLSNDWWASASAKLRFTSSMMSSTFMSDRSSESFLFCRSMAFLYKPSGLCISSNAVPGESVALKPTFNYSKSDCSDLKASESIFKKFSKSYICLELS